MGKYVLIILCALLLTIGCKLHDPEINSNGISIDKIREAKELVLQKDSRVHAHISGVNISGISMSVCLGSNLDFFRILDLGYGI